MAVSGSEPKLAPSIAAIGLLRPTQTRRRHSCNRLARSAAVNSPARCAIPKFVPNIEPVARGTGEQSTRIANPVLTGRFVPMRCMLPVSRRVSDADGAAGRDDVARLELYANNNYYVC